MKFYLISITIIVSNDSHQNRSDLIRFSQEIPNLNFIYATVAQKHLIFFHLCRCCTKKCDKFFYLSHCCPIFF
jgi:hypothetical protein